MVINLRPNHFFVVNDKRLVIHNPLLTKHRIGENEKAEKNN
jgi:hypothetical protein